MSKTLQLRVITSLQDKLSGPLKKISGAGGSSAKSMKDLRDKLRGLERTQKDVGRFRELKSGLQTTSRQMDQNQTELDQLAQAMRQTKNPSKEMQRDFKRLTERAASLKNEHGRQSQELQKLRDGFKKAGISTKSLSKGEIELRQNIEKTNKQIERQQDRMRRLAAQQRKLGEARERLQRAQAFAGSMAAAGAAGLGVGYGVKNVAERLLAPGISYGSQVSELQAVSRLGKDSEEMRALREQARGLGASTAFSAAEVAAGQTFLARAGFSPQAILSSMQDMLELALANNVALDRTADIASNIASAFKIDPEQEGNMQRVADVLSGVAARTNVDLEMLGETMKYLGQAEGLDISLEQAAAMAGLLGNIGIQGSQAGTTMRAMMNRLSAPSKAARKIMAELGLEVADAEGNLRDLPDIFSDISTAMDGMGSAQQAAYLKELFGEVAGSGMAELIKQQGMGAFADLIEQLYSDVEGENRRMAMTRADNIEGDLKGLWSAWEEVGIGITDINEGPLRDLIQQITGIVREVGLWMQRNPELVATIAKVVAVVGILAAAGGALLVTLAGIIGPLAMLRYGITVLGIKGGGLLSVLTSLGGKVLPVVLGGIKAIGAAIMANPIAAIIAGIALAAFLIYKYWEPIKNFFAGLWDEVKEAFSGGITGIGALILDWSPAGLIYRAFAGVLEYFDIELPEKLSDAIGVISADVLKLFGGLWDEVKEAFSGGITGIGALILDWSPVGLFYKAFADVMGYLGHDLPSKFSEFGKMIIDGLISGIKSLGPAVKDAVMGVGGSAVNWFKEKLGIKSPSRVFIGLGENISEGAAEGIGRQSGLAVKALKNMTAGLLAAGLAAPAGAGSYFDLAGQVSAFRQIKFDSRQPIPAQRPSPQLAPAGPDHSNHISGDRIEIHVHAAPGQSELDIARAVAAELERREREKMARARSSLHDY